MAIKKTKDEETTPTVQKVSEFIEDLNAVKVFDEHGKEFPADSTEGLDLLKGELNKAHITLHDVEVAAVKMLPNVKSDAAEFFRVVRIKPKDICFTLEKLYLVWRAAVQSHNDMNPGDKKGTTIMAFINRCLDSSFSATMPVWKAERESVYSWTKNTLNLAKRLRREADQEESVRKQIEETKARMAAEGKSAAEIKAALEDINPERITRGAKPRADKLKGIKSAMTGTAKIILALDPDADDYDRKVEAAVEYLTFSIVEALALPLHRKNGEANDLSTTISEAFKAKVSKKAITKTVSKADELKKQLEAVTK